MNVTSFAAAVLVVWVTFPTTTNAQPADSVIVQISGFGPTDTHYFDAANEPKSQEKH